MKINKKDMRLYAITDRTWLGNDTLVSQVEEVLSAGATFLQLREKEFNHEQMIEEARQIKVLTDKYKVPFVINDDIYAAKEIDADGVHIGQSDMEYTKARQILGPDKIIGVSAGTVEQAVRAEKMGADYIGVGAVFHTSTKKDAKDMSRETLLAIASSVDIPIVAIGGINADNMEYLRGTGVNGVAVISAIFAKKDKKSAVKELLTRTKQVLGGTIFDMDGTILDSMNVWADVGRDYLISNSITPPDKFNEIVFNMTLTESAEYMIDQYNLKLTVNEIVTDIISRINDEYEFRIPAKKGMVELVKSIKAAGRRMCILTSSDRNCAVKAMTRLGIIDCFEEILTDKTFGISKRHTELYSRACEHMGFNSEYTDVYEDVLYGILSAKEAGCKTIGVYDESSDTDWDEIVRISDEQIVCD